MPSADVPVSPGGDKQLAPWLSIPSRGISVVEHPCIIKNVDKGIKSLGGGLKLSKALIAKPVPDPESENGEQLPEMVSASLRPDDPTAKRILATSVTTTNLLLKVTVPKRTGRKRKRGSTGPFVADDDETGSNPYHAHVTATDVYRSLLDNASKYNVTPVGVVNESHRFRTLPDIQYSAGRDEIMDNIKNNLFPLRYSQLKNFNINTAPGADMTKNIGPSAEYIQMPVAYGYKFQQNAFVKYTGDGRQEVNTQRRMALFGCTIIKMTSETVPTGPKNDLPPEGYLTPYMQSLIADIRDELQHRPIITRHYLFNRLGWDKRDRVREALIYCGYFFESGPWREALISWGLDPRKDPAFRHYQTVSFMSYQSTGQPKRYQVFDEHVRKLVRMSPAELAHEHIFDGIRVSDTGHLFQFCDITDPLLRGILDTEDIRAVCAPTFQGWYHVGTWAKATVILKDKMNWIISGKSPDNTIYSRIITWPEKWDDQELYATYRKEVWDPEVHKEKKKEHQVMYTVRSAARNPRWAFEKIDKMMKQRSDKGSDAEMEDEEEIPEDATEVPETAATIFKEGELSTAGQADDYSGDDDEDAFDRNGAWEGEDSDSDATAPAGERDRTPLPFGGLYQL